MLFKVVPGVNEQEWKDEVCHSGVFRQQTILNFTRSHLIKIIQVSFLEIWPLARGACRRFLTLQVTFFVSFQMSLDMIATVPKKFLVT